MSELKTRGDSYINYIKDFGIKELSLYLETKAKALKIEAAHLRIVGKSLGADEHFYDQIKLIDDAVNALSGDFDVTLKKEFRRDGKI